MLSTPTRCIAIAPLGESVRSPSGVVSTAVLATILDVASSDPALIAAAPDWTATLDLSVHSGAWLTKGPLVIDNHLVRAGSRFVVVRADVYDAMGHDDIRSLPAAIDAGELDTVAGRCLISFARLPRAAASDVDDYDPATWIGEIRRRRPAEPASGTTLERMGVRIVDAASGTLELDRTPYVANSIGTINGGAQAVLAEAAAEAARPGLVTADLQMRFLAQVRSGPARTSCTVVRDEADHAVIDVELRDAGADLLLTLATVTLRRPPPIVR
ncbi:MAG: acyl-CoA thioesterase domain-containing protein [Acidimicrobiales bacterium]